MTRVYDCFKNNPSKKVVWLNEAPDAPHGAFLGLDRSKNDWMIKGAEKWRPFSEVYCPFSDGHSRNVNENIYGTSYSCDSQRTVKDYQGDIVRLPEDFAPMEGARYDTSAYFDGGSYLDCGNDPVLQITDNLDISATIVQLHTLPATGTVISKAGPGNTLAWKLILNKSGSFGISVSSDGGVITGTDSIWYTGSNYYANNGDTIRGTVIGGIIKLYLNGIEVPDGDIIKSRNDFTGSIFNTPHKVTVGEYDGITFRPLDGSVKDIKVKSNGTTVLDLPLTNYNYTDQTGKNTVVNNGVYDVATDVHNTDTNGNVLSGIVYQPEGQATNYIRRSEMLDMIGTNAWNWNASRILVTAESYFVLGGLRAYKFTEQPVATGHSVNTYNSLDISSTGMYVFSCFVKAKERSHIQIDLADDVFSSGTGASYTRAVFDLVNGTSNLIENGYGTGSAGIEQFTNGWHRCWVASDHIDTRNNMMPFIHMHNGKSRIYNGDGVSSLFVTGAQLEAGTIPSSYNPTNGTLETRLPGSLTVGADVFNTNKLTIAGTVRWDGQIDGSVTYLVTGTGGYIRYAFASNNFDLFENGTLYRTPVNMDTGEFHVAVVVNETLVKTYINGSLAETFNRVNNPSVFPGGMNIGSTSSSSYVKYLKDFTVKRTALSDNEIQQLYQFSK